jgi:hypothetical protein
MSNTLHTKAASPRSLEAVLAFIRSGGTVYLATATRITPIDARTLARFEKAGTWLLKEDGDGYRLHSGKGSVYIAPGYLRYESPAA